MKHLFFFSFILFTVLLGCTENGIKESVKGDISTLEGIDKESSDSSLEGLANPDLEVDESLVSEPESDSSELDQMVEDYSVVENDLEADISEFSDINTSDFE